MRPRVPFCSVLLLAVASAALAAPSESLRQVSPTGPAAGPSSDLTARTRSVCSVAYSNNTTITGTYSAGPGKEVIDDLHLAGVGDLCAFGFSYSNGSGGPTDATVTFYANDGPLGSPGTVIAGPFFFTGLPIAGGGVQWEIPETVATIGPDLWMGVSFTAAGISLLTADPPTVGSSADRFYQRPEEAFFSFGGSPVASFALLVDVDAPTPVRPSTWGTLKTIYRD